MDLSATRGLAAANALPSAASGHNPIPRPTASFVVVETPRSECNRPEPASSSKDLREKMKSKTTISRREVLRLALASPLFKSAPVISQTQSKQATRLDQRAFLRAPSAVIPVGASDVKQIAVVRRWRE